MQGGNTSSPWQSIVLRLALSDETAIAPTLERLNSRLHDLLAVGSYPVTDQVQLAQAVAVSHGLNTSKSPASCCAQGCRTLIVPPIVRAPRQ